MSSASRRSRIPWSMITIFMVLTVAILVAGIFTFEEERRSLNQTTQAQLNAVADLDLLQISAWLNERRGDAQMVLENPLFAEHVQQILSGTSDDKIRQDTLTWMDIIQTKGQYKQVLLLDPRGKVFLSSPKNTGSIPISDRVIQMTDQAAQSKQIVFSDLYVDPLTKQAYLDLVVPLSLRQSEVSSAAIGSLVLRIDPYSYLYKLLETRPIPGDTSENYLVRKDQDQIVYLSLLRMRSDPPISLSAPIQQAGAPSIQAVQGDNGLVTGVDYRGALVIAATRKIPGTDWGLVTKIDQAEIYASLVEREWLAIGLLSLILLIAGLMVGFTWRHREALFYKEQYENEVRRAALNQHLKTLTKYANDIILLMDEKWAIQEANDRAQSQYGYTPEELSRLTLRDLQSEAAQSEFDWQAEELRKREGIVFETMHRRKDYSAFPVECSSRIIHVEGKVFYQSIIRDITERRRAEHELRDSEYRFRLFYEQAPVAYQSIDGEGILTDVNKAWLRLTGVSKDEAVGKPFSTFLSEISREHLRPALDQLRITAELDGEELEVTRADGSMVITAMYAKGSFDERGALRQVNCILYDITEQKGAEDKIRRMNDELERRVVERTAQLEAANRELEAFSYSVSHDLRAPLRAIDGFSRILSEEYCAELSADAQHTLHRVRENTQTMSNLIDNLLSFSRLSRQPLKKQSIDPTPLVNQSLDLLAADRSKGDVEFIIQPLPPCQADPALLKQVFVNLLSNALKFSGKQPDAVIEVGCLQENQENIYYVKDNGVGFDMQYSHKLFGVFQRLHRPEEYEGTGVGLAIVQRIIHRHGGRVWATGEPDHGATFCFTLEGETGHD
ncbi:MAG TPA: PAS domain S-box protein [Anaerolineaceae bacterium]|jgi:PAS domain S-box-containing protein